MLHPWLFKYCRYAASVGVLAPTERGWAQQNSPQQLGDFRQPFTLHPSLYSSSTRSNVTSSKETSPTAPNSPT